MRSRFLSLCLTAAVLFSGSDSFAVEPSMETMAMIESLRAKAEAGDVTAQASLGALFDSLEDTKMSILKDADVKAVKWYRLVAEQGFANIQSHLGQHYADGEGVPIDHVEAMIWWERAAEQGFAEAQFLLGTAYSDEDIGQPVDLVQSVKWMLIFVGTAVREGASKQEAVMVGMMTAMIAMEMSQEEVDEAERQAKEWLDSHEDVEPKIVTIPPEVLQQIATGQQLLKSSYLESLIERAEAGDVDSQLKLAKALRFGELDGEKIQRDRKQAYVWFRKAAESGLAEAQMEMAKEYVSCKFKQTRGGECGFGPFAFGKSGPLYEEYIAGARNWYLAVAEGGDPEGYFKGFYYVAEPAEAMSWLKKAAELGHRVSMAELGHIYYGGKIDLDVGRISIPKDLVQAHFWYHAVGNVKQTDWLEREMMTPEQVTKAKRLAAEWRKKNKKD